MTEEVKIPELSEFEEISDEVVEVESPTEATATPTPEETLVVKAREMGWVPKEEFKGDADTWVDAKEFVGRAPLFDALHKANRKIKQLDERYETLTKHHIKVFEAAKKKALEEYRVQLKEASDNSDIDKALEIKDKIDDLEEQVFEAETVTTPDKEITKTDENAEYVKTFKSWEEQNNWYKDDEDLKVIADGYGVQIWKKNPELTYEEVLVKVTEKVKSNFPTKFGEESPKKKPGVVAKPSSGVVEKGKTKVTYSQLPDETKEVYRLLVKSDRNPGGIYTHEEFIKEYLAIGGTV